MTAIRMSGLASGLDVDTIVETLVNARKQQTVDKVYRKRVKQEWIQEKYREVSTQIVDFRNNKLSSYNLASVMKAKTATVTGDTDAVTAKTTSSAKTGSLNVVVNNVAKAASTVLKFDNFDSTSGATNALKDLGFTDDDGDGEISVTVGGTTVTVDEDGTLDDLVSAINDSDSGFTAIYNGAGSIAITSQSTGVTGISGLMTDDSSTSDVDETGYISLDGFDDAVSSANMKQTAGEDAEIVVNGLTYTQASNKVTVNGVELTATAETEAGSASTITVAADTEGIVNSIKSFVEDYNSLLTTLYDVLHEESDSDYYPLTEDEESEMTENQIELWNETAKSGLLKNDSMLSSLMSNLRLISIGSVGTSGTDYTNITSVGITTGSYGEYGKLEIDEDALTEAIEKDPDMVANLFYGSGSATYTNSAGGTVYQDGIFNRMYDACMDTLQQLQDKAGTSLTSTSTSQSFLETSSISILISNYEDKEDDLNDKLDTYEESLYKKFTAMETAINELNSQSSQLSG